MCAHVRDAKESRLTVACVGTLGAARFRRGCGACAARVRRRPPSRLRHSFSWIFGVRSSFGGCNCWLLDALAGGFRGRGKESNARHIIGECNYRFLDALAGEFRGRGKESNVPHIIGECNCRVLDALSGGLGVVERKAMCGFSRQVKWK